MTEAQNIILCAYPGCNKPAHSLLDGELNVCDEHDAQAIFIEKVIVARARFVGIKPRTAKEGEMGK